MYTALHPTPRQRDRAYIQIKSKLLNGDFPFAERLGEVALARELEASRTPVREALLRLFSEGLVERHSEGGFRPILPDARVIHELYDVRVALEHHALTQPIRSGREHERDVLEQLHSEWSALATEEHDADPEFVLLDESFHIGLAQASANPTLVEMLHGVNERIRIVRVHDFLSVERIVTTISQHLGILEALLSGEPQLAVERWRLHLEESLAVVDERSAQACLRMINAGRSER